MDKVSLPPIKAVISDFIGTLTNLKDYNLEASRMKLYRANAKAGFTVDAENFLEAYGKSHQEYHVVRYQNWLKSPTPFGFQRLSTT